MGRTWIDTQGHAQCTSKGLKYGLNLVVCIYTPNVIDVQGHAGVVYKATEELDAQIHIKVTHPCAGG